MTSEQKQAVNDKESARRRKQRAEKPRTVCKCGCRRTFQAELGRLYYSKSCQKRAEQEVKKTIQKETVKKGKAPTMGKPKVRKAQKMQGKPLNPGDGTRFYHPVEKITAPVERVIRAAYANADEYERAELRALNPDIEF